MKSWVVSFVGGGQPLVLQEVPPPCAPQRNPEEGDVEVDWHDETGIEVFIPGWCRRGEGAKRTFYPWHVISSVEEYGE